MFPAIQLESLKHLCLLAGAAVLGLGLLPQFTALGISIATFLLLLTLAVYPASAGGSVRLAFPRTWLLLPILLISILRIQTAESLEIAARVVIGCLVAMAIIADIDSEPKLRRFLKAIVIGAILLLAILDYYSLVVFRSPFLTADIEIPTRAGRNSVGFFLSIAMPATFVFPSIFARIAILAFFVANAVYLQSRGALLAFATAGSLALAVKIVGSLARPFSPLARRVSLPILVWPAVAITSTLIFRQQLSSFLRSFVFVAHTSDDLRLRLADLAADAFRAHAFLGIGAGKFQYYSPEGLLTHNDYLAVLAECGILGFVPFLLMMAGVALLPLRLLHASMWGGQSAASSHLLIQAMVGTALATYLFVINGYTALAFWVGMGIVHAKWQGVPNREAKAMPSELAA